jgi:hypothetical protein
LTVIQTVGRAPVFFAFLPAMAIGVNNCTKKVLFSLKTPPVSGDNDGANVFLLP